MNFKIKIKVGEDDYVHLKVYRPLPNTGEPNELKEAVGGKKAADSL